MTRLEALNQMLAGIGEAPVSSETSSHPDALVGNALLNRQEEQLQAKGYWFNTDLSLSLVPEASTGYLIIPSTTLKIDPVDPTLQYVRRGTKLYNSTDHTYVFTESIICDVVSKLPFVELPTVAQAYISAESTYRLALDLVGDTNKLASLAQLRAEAKIDFNTEHLRNSDFNARTAPTAAHLLGRVIPYRR